MTDPAPTLSNTAAVRAILSRHGLAPSKDRGQNFLVDPRVAESLVDLAGVVSDDSVIEIGTGLGILSRALAARAERVLTLEIDAGLVRALGEEALLPENVTLRHQDALDVSWPALVRESGATRVVANLPYAVSAPLLRRLLDLAGALRDWSVMIQRDVADRLLAEPGSRDYSSLTVLHRLCVVPRREREIASGDFHPVPGVRSSFVRMRPVAAPPSPDELARIERVVRAAFGQRRKTLANALRGAGFAAAASACERAGIDPRTRAEQLPPEAFVALSRAFEAIGAAP